MSDSIILVRQLHRGMSPRVKRMIAYLYVVNSFGGEKKVT